MNPVECILFDCDGTLVDSEVLCSMAYVHMFAQQGITLSLDEVFKKYKGVKLYEIIERVGAEQGISLPTAQMEPVYRQELARLFDSQLQPIPGAAELLAQIAVPVCTVSNGPVSKMQVPLERCILIDDSMAGAQAGIAAGIPVFYFCADPHNKPIAHPLVTPFHRLDQLPALWEQRGWRLTNG